LLNSVSVVSNNDNDIENQIQSECLVSQNVNDHFEVLSNLELLHSIDKNLLNKKVVKQIEPEDLLISVTVYNTSRVVGKQQIEYRLNAVSIADSIDSIDDLEVKALVNSFRDVFPERLPAGLPPKRIVDHHINLKADTQPFNSHSYRMNQVELQSLRKQLDELLEQRCIEPSLSEYGSPCLFVKKKSGELRLVIDYRKLNAATIKMNYSLPRIDESLERFRGSKYFSKLDLNSGYFQIRIAEEDVKKTAFNTRFGSYQFRVLPFGLTGGPSTFMLMMNEVFRDIIDRGIVIYMDDICVYTETKEEHIMLLKQVFERLKKITCSSNWQSVNFFNRRFHFLVIRLPQKV
jgi:hypothetical protein